VFVKKKYCTRKTFSEIFWAKAERKEFAEWYSTRSKAFLRYYHTFNETERWIIYLRVHIGEENRENIAKKVGIKPGTVRSFLEKYTSNDLYPVPPKAESETEARKLMEICNDELP
jgi:hypothetical protein